MSKHFDNREKTLKYYLSFNFGASTIALINKSLCSKRHGRIYLSRLKHSTLTTLWTEVRRCSSVVPTSELITSQKG